jgi:A/G-specific adenine glycosylase
VARGGVPRDPDGLRALPGVGPYTAGAVGSIALGLDMAAVDGNVERVLCRHDARPEPPATIRRALWARAEALVPPGEAGDHNQALMELGATVCTPTSPACDRCPLARACAGRADPTRYPARVAKRPVPEAHCHVARVVEDGAVLLVRRAGTGLLGGLWELPGSVPSPGAEDPAALVSALDRRVGLAVLDHAPLATVTHVFTHLRLHATVHAVRIPTGATARPAEGYDEARWVGPGDLSGLALSTWARKTLRAGALRGRPEPPPQEG